MRNEKRIGRREVDFVAELEHEEETKQVEVSRLTSL